MSPIDPLRRRFGDEWSYALVGALVSTPLVALGYLRTGSELSLTPVLLGGVLAGYLAVRDTGTRRGIGFKVGVLGALPALLIVADLLGALSGLGGPRWFVAAGVVFFFGALVALLGMVVGLSVLAGEVGTRIGGRIAVSTIRRRGAGG